MIEAAAGEYVLLERGTTGFEVDDGDRTYVKVLDSDGNVIFHGQAGEVFIEVLGPKGKS